jgi:hypothetical protein
MTSNSGFFPHEAWPAALYSITPVGAVIPGAPAQKRLGVYAIGSQLRFLVNDIELLELNDGPLRFGGTRLMARARRGSQTTMSFDSFRIWDLSVLPEG